MRKIREFKRFTKANEGILVTNEKPRIRKSANQGISLFDILNIKGKNIIWRMLASALTVLLLFMVNGEHLLFMQLTCLLSFPRMLHTTTCYVAAVSCIKARIHRQNVNTKEEIHFLLAYSDDYRQTIDFIFSRPQCCCESCAKQTIVYGSKQ